jgi:hypothetical protein
MNCVFLILAHQRLEQVSRLARRLLSGGAGVVIHVDRRAQIPANFLSGADAGRRSRVFLAHPRHATAWGSFELVSATLSLMEEGVRRFPSARNLVLVSGQHYPIKSAEAIDAFFSEHDANFIDCVPIREHSWKYGRTQRINRYYWTRNKKSLLGYFFRTVPCPPRRFPIPVEKLYVGSQWWSLKREAVVKVLDLLGRNPTILRAFRWTYVPDEFFFQSVLKGFLHQPTAPNKHVHHVEFFALPRDYFRLKIFNRSGIRVLGVGDFEKLKATPSLLARKFDVAVDSKILDLLDEL